MATRKKGKKPKKNAKKKLARKAPSKKFAKKPAKKSRRKAPAKSKAPSNRRLVRTRAGSRRPENRVPPTSETQAGDLQGLSRRERADSESVDELLEEGNAFEAGIVQGVEEADDSETREVTTHEVPEDDVPEEYLDRDND
jgi:hypothetical protein